MVDRSPAAGWRFPLSAQWVAILILIVAAIQGVTSFVDVMLIPTQHIRLVRGTPAAWLPLWVASACVIGALLLERRARAVSAGEWLVLATLFVASVAWFLHGGRIDWQVSPDWQKEWLYSTALQEAVMNWRIPWHLEFSFQGTTRFLANPETLAAPQALALRWLSIPTFLFAQFVALAAAGIVALRVLMRDLEFGPTAALAWLMLFVLNGHLLAHVSAGHLQWVAYFGFAGVFLFLYRAASGDLSRRTRAGLALTLAGMVAIGGWHLFVWVVIFILVFVAVDRRRWTFGVQAGVLTAGLCAYRILPAAMTFGTEPREFLASFERMSPLVLALIGEPLRYAGLESHEFDTFVGWPGFILICAGLTAPLNRMLWKAPVSAFWWPSLVVSALACYDLYELTLFQLPGFASERIVSRFLILGALGFMLIGCAQLNAWLRHGHVSGAHWRALALAGIFLSAQLLVRADQRRPVAPSAVPRPPLETNVISSDPPDRTDVVTLSVGGTITAWSLVVAIRWWRQRRDDAIAMNRP